MSKQILRDSLAVRRILEVNPSDLKDDVIAINRVTKVVKGGKNLSFSALVVVGDSHGHAGFGMGKAREVPMAIKKGIEQAKKNLIKLNLKGSTIPHQVTGRYGSAQVLLKPASGRHRRDCRRSRAQGDAGGGNSERAHEVAWHFEPAQRGESHVRGAAQLEGCRASGGNALQDRGRNQRPSAKSGEAKKRKRRQGNKSWQQRKKARRAPAR